MIKPFDFENIGQPMKWRVQFTDYSGEVKYLHTNGRTLVYDSPEEAADAMHDFISPDMRNLNTTIVREERYCIELNMYFQKIEVVPAGQG